MAEQRARRGRAGLDLETVLSAAEGVVDRLGWDGLTMSELARELGVRAPSLYHHVKSVDAVRGHLQARTLAAMGEAIAAASDGHRGSAGIAVQAQAQRAFARTCPHRYEGIARATLDPERMGAAAVVALDAVHEMLLSAGVPSSALEDVRRVVFCSHHGFIALELAGFFPAGAGTDALWELVVEGSVRTVEAAASAHLREHA